MKGLIQEISGIPVFEDKLTPEGTYICLDKNNLPIKINSTNEIGKVEISKIIVHDIETFKMAIKNNLLTK